MADALSRNQTADLAAVVGQAAIDAISGKAVKPEPAAVPEPAAEPAGAGDGFTIEQGLLLSDVSDALQDGSERQTLKAVQAALDGGIPAQMILTKGLVRGMNELGEDFSAGEVFVPEMLRAAKCMSSSLEVLKPLLAGASGSKPAGRVCLGTVRGDLHDIGKNLVRIMMEGSGLEVIDLGCDVSAETFVQTAIDERCDIIACSSLLTTSMDEMRRVVEVAKERGIRDKVRILIGGAPITQEFCDEIGADAYTDDAAASAR
ncbi:MAG: corrinoid protein, partial [Mogibacterium sp.]|nr:corrinoid protein [Mogibacterium sp.]